MYDKGNIQFNCYDILLSAFDILYRSIHWDRHFKILPSSNSRASKPLCPPLHVVGSLLDDIGICSAHLLVEMGP